MNLPFSLEQFIEVFRRYNERVWPAQWALGGLALLTVIAVVWPNARSSRVVSVALSALWLWAGVVYHVLFFRRINPAALIFGSAFALQGLAIAWWGTRRRALRFGPRRPHGAAFVALALMVYALVFYPLFGIALGHRYPAAPTFGAPCPTTIFTIAVLLLASSPRPLMRFVVPIAWCLIGSVAAAKLGMLEDLGLVVAAIGAVAVLIHERTHRTFLVRSGSLVHQS